MNEYALSETNITTTSNLDSLERSLATLIDNFQLLKLEKEQIEQEYRNLMQSHNRLLEKQHLIEHRVKTLLDRLVSVDI
jgi:hypothetical protein